MTVSLVAQSAPNSRIGYYPGNWPWGIGNTGSGVVRVPIQAQVGDLVVVALFGRGTTQYGNSISTFTLAGSGWTPLGDHSTVGALAEFAWENATFDGGVTYNKIQRARIVARVFTGSETSAFESGFGMYWIGPTINVSFGYSGTLSGGSSHFGHEYWVGVYSGGTWTHASDVTAAQSWDNDVSLNAPSGQAGVGLWISQRGATSYGTIYNPSGIWTTDYIDRSDSTAPIATSVKRGSLVVPANAPSAIIGNYPDTYGITGLCLPARRDRCSLFTGTITCTTRTPNIRLSVLAYGDGIYPSECRILITRNTTGNSLFTNVRSLGSGPWDLGEFQEDEEVEYIVWRVTGGDHIDGFIDLRATDTYWGTTHDVRITCRPRGWVVGSVCVNIN